MVDAYKKFWGNFGNFSGVTGRKDYWLASIVNILVLLAMIILLMWDRPGSTLSLIIAAIVMMIVNFGSLTMQVRRLRDAGFHWAWMLIVFLPYIGSVVLIVLVCMPTKQQP